MAVARPSTSRSAESAGRLTLLLLALTVAATGGCDRGTATPAAVPVAAAASVAPLAALTRAVGGKLVEVQAFAAGARRVGDYGDRDASQSPYRPDAAALLPFRRATFLAVDGRADAWALGGLSPEMAGSPLGPVLQLASLPAARDLAAADVAGALWLDPLTMAQAARDAAERLGVLRPESARPLRASAQRLAGRLEGMTAGRSPRWKKVAVVGDEPLPLLRRLGIEWVRVEPETGRVVPSPARVAETARAAGATAVLLCADWAEATRDDWSRATGLAVALYRPLGPPGLAQAADPAEALVGWMSFNLDELSRRN